MEKNAAFIQRFKLKYFIQGLSYEGGVYRKIADQADKDELNHMITLYL